jgi:antitoxin (DNA-binding transcriptional repressor) of toxin-antitoxin stability system
MVTISSLEIAPQLPRLLALLRRGEEINITEEGQSVARLVPIPSAPIPPLTDENEEERPWGGVMVSPRSRRQTQPAPTTLPIIDTLPKRSRAVNMGWHRTDEADD